MKLISVAVLSGLICAVVSSRVKRETGCPSRREVAPCNCYHGNYLECVNLNNVDVLRNIFNQSERYTFYQVNISTSSLLYLPHEIFDKAPVYELILHNVNMARLFDIPPETSALEMLHIENGFSQRRLDWTFLKHLPNLKILNVFYNYVRILGSNFGSNAPKNLTQLTFYGTGTKKIFKGAFASLENLIKIAVDSCQLTTLTRDIFPNKFYVKMLYFDNNQINSIPGNLFTEMPRLQIVSLKNNQITTMQDKTFGDQLLKMSYLYLDGNKLICNCELKWLIKKRRAYIGGRCANGSLRGLKNKLLNELKGNDFRC